MKNVRPSQNVGAWIVGIMLAMIAFPVALTLRTVHTPAALSVSDSDPTPYGYTWSLLLFIVPIIVIGWWFLPGEGIEIPQRTFWRTIWILVPLGFGLDFFFANRFFQYPNSGATLRIGAWALGGDVPVEEYVFYLTGFIAVLLIYIWLDEYWLAAYTVPRSEAESQPAERLLQFHASSLIAGAVILGAAVLYKKLRSPVPGGFPEYFAVLVTGGLIPSVGFFPAARRVINWRALSLTMFMILLISMFWEATLAVPYGWWRYQPNRMMGLFIGAWDGLPIEAVFVWLAVTYATAIVYEIVKLWQASGNSARHAFLGRPKPRA
jgi:hypothetical protein